MNPKELAAEFIGTFWLVLGGCGAAVLAAGWGYGGDYDAAAPLNLGIGFVGVSLAFGLTVVTGAYAVGHISGGHFNPAVSVGLAVGGRFNPAKLVGYIIAQVLGGIVAAAVIYLIASGKDGWEIGDGAGAFATNGFGDLSPTGYSMLSALVIEVVLTAMFLIIIMGATAKKAAPGFGGLAIGLGLVLIHLISIPVTNTSVNPARSTSQALFAGGDYIAQLWLFWLAPIVGAAIGAAIYRGLIDSNGDEDEVAAVTTKTTTVRTKKR